MREHEVEVRVGLLEELLVGGGAGPAYRVADAAVQALGRRALRDLRLVVAVPRTRVQQVRVRVHEARAHKAAARVDRALRRI